MFKRLKEWWQRNIEPKEPFVVRYLGDNVADWRVTRGILVMHPRDGKLDELTIYKHPVGLSSLIPIGEFKWEFHSTIQIIPPERMNEECKELYRKLKREECELRYKGLMRKPFFTPFLGPLSMKGLVPNYLSSERLLSILNSNEELMNLLYKTKPYNLYVLLSLEIGLHEFYEERQRAMQEMALNYYCNPKRIQWAVSLVMGDFLRTRGMVISLYKILSMISDHLREVTLAEMGSKTILRDVTAKKPCLEE